MNYSSFNRRNIKPRKNSIKKILDIFSKFLTGKNKKHFNNVKASTKKAFSSPNKSPKLTVKEFKKIFIKLISISSIIFIVLFISWFLFSSPVFKIKNININIENDSYKDSLIKIVNNQIKLKRSLWNQDNIFLFKKDDFIKSLNKVYGDFFYDINIVRKIPGILSIDMKERSPKVVFVTSQNKFYFDDKAKLILSTNNIDNDINITKKALDKNKIVNEISIENNVLKDNGKKDEDIINELINNKTELNNNINELIENDIKKQNNNEINNTFSYINKEELFKNYKFSEVFVNNNIQLKDGDVKESMIVFLMNIEPKLKNKSINIKKILLESINDSKVIIITDVGYEIYLNIGNSIDKQVEYLGVVIKDKIKDDIKKIKYIDLRFDSKIYYK